MKNIGKKKLPDTQEELDLTPEDTEKITQEIKKSEISVKDYQFFLIRLGIFVVAVWLIFFVLIGATHMPSGDMIPGMAAGDLVIFYRLDKDVQAQDLVVIEKNVPELNSKGLFICRVVAVAGDTVEISDDDRLIVNGNAVIEHNIYFPTPRYEGFVEYPLTLQEGECFVLADYREGGTDSRFFGPVTKSEIDGTVITIIRKNNL